jgi:cytochrome c5
MCAARHLTQVVAIVLCLLTIDRLAQSDEPGKVTGQSSYLTFSGKTDGKPYGFAAMRLLKIDGKPAACFGLHQPPGGKARYTYLLLFKPNPKSERGTGVGGKGGASDVFSSDGTIACDLKMQAFAQGHEIAVDYQLKADAKAIASETLKVDGKEYGKDGPRVFLVDLADEKPKCVAVKVVPKAVPEFGDEDAWGKRILEAVKELKEKSPEAKAFFGETK